jgi:hypothetical protein
MGRRKKGNLREVFELCYLVPWWIGAALAVASYFFLHQYAIVEVVSNGNVRSVLTSSIIKSVSSVFQIILPAVFGAGSIASLVNQKSKNNYDN